MAFTYEESWSSDVTSTMDDKGYVVSQATRMITCASDSLKDDEGAALSGLPPLGSIHPRLGVAYVLKSRKLKKTAPRYYEATLNYRTAASDNPDNQNFPWNEPAKVEFSTINESGTTEVDADGDEIKTVNGEVFSVPKDYADQGIAIKKALQSYSSASFYTYINTVNADEFLGFPAGTLRVTGVSATPAVIDQTTYYNVSVQIAARKPTGTAGNAEAWYWQGPERGYYVLDSKSSNAEPRNAGISGRPAPAPVIINADGTQNRRGDPVNIRLIQIYETSTFASMGIL